MRNSYRIMFTAVLCGASFFGPLPAGADEIAEAGRKLLEANKDAIVTVSVVSKQNFSGQGFQSDEESKTEITGTVIDPSGLTVVALSATDPTSVITQMMGDMMQDMNISSEITDAKILMQDGSEVPVQIVLRDKDLDLAFLRPVEPVASPMPAVDLASAAEAQLLDQLIVINRLGRVAGRTYGLSLERIEAVVERPRRFYIPGKDPTNSSLGCPSFTPDGKLVGILVLRTMAAGGGGGGMMSMLGNAQEGIAAIILPASDVAEVAAQAPQVGEAPVETGDDEPEEPAAEEEAPVEE